MSDDQNSVVTLKVRVTPEFREKIIAEAKANNRSMNAEIVYRLDKSFENSERWERISENQSVNKALIPALGEKKPAVNNLNERKRLAQIAAMAVMQALEDDDNKKAP